MAVVCVMRKKTGAGVCLAVERCTMWMCTGGNALLLCRMPGCRHTEVVVCGEPTHQWWVRHNMECGDVTNTKGQLRGLW